MARDLTHLSEIDVFLKGTHIKASTAVAPGPPGTSPPEAPKSIQITMSVNSVSLENHYVERYVYGNPKDWIQRKWSHGVVTMSGCVFNTNSNSDEAMTQLLQGKYMYKLELGGVATLLGCRKLGAAITAVDVARNGKAYIVGAISYRFDKYE